MTDRKILIIDDDMTALDIVDYLFEDKGFDVIRRADGVSALECLESETPDIILIDLMMPRMSGQECIKHIRDRGIPAPIVAFTAVDDPEVHDEALEAGCNLVLTKPCKPAVLVKHIEDLIAQAEAQ
jgi:CheY-like chemotaxis protein